MKGAVLAMAVLLVGLALADPVQVVPPRSVGMSTERLTQIEKTVQGLADEGKIAGAVTLISRKGKVAHLRTFGYMDVEARRPMREDAIFRIASMTKAVTAVAVLQLFEQGHFMLDDPVSKFIPEIGAMRVLDPNQAGADPNQPRTVRLARPITPRDLLRHTAMVDAGSGYARAGLPRWTGSLKGFVERIASVPLACQPGTEFHYGYSMDVLGYLVEVVSGQGLDEYFSQHIFQPLGLADTGFVVPPDAVSRLTNHYRFADGRLVCKEQAASSPFLKRAEALSGGGGWGYSYPGLVTTVHDWWQFLEMLRGHGQFNGVRVLSRKTVELMCSDQLCGIPGFHEPGASQGLGLGVVTDSARHGQLTSTGTVYWAGGPHNTYYFVDFKEEMCGIFFMQTEPWKHLDLMHRFLVMSHQAIDD